VPHPQKPSTLNPKSEIQIGRQNLSLVQTKLKEVQEKAERFEGMYMKKIKQVEELETKAKGFQHLAEKHAAEVRHLLCRRIDGISTDLSSSWFRSSCLIAKFLARILNPS
jgi:hypothetical protein